MRPTAWLFFLLSSWSCACDSANSSEKSADPCAPSQFTCGTGECLATSSACNGVADCADGSDELGCPFGTGGSSWASGTGALGGTAALQGSTPGGGGWAATSLPPAGSGATLMSGGSGGVPGSPTGGAGGTSGSLPGGVGAGPAGQTGGDEGSGGVQAIGGGGSSAGTGGDSSGGVTLGGTEGTAEGGGAGGPPVAGGTGASETSGGNSGTGGTSSGGTGEHPGGAGAGQAGQGAAGAVGAGGEAGEGPTAGYALTSAQARDILEAEYASWHETYFRDCGDGSACIVDGSRCVSEGIGYGMLLAVSRDDQDSFDKLWTFYTNHLNANGVMNWQADACGATTAQNGATDAELDAAMALIQAEARWGGYATAATDLITAIRDHETETCQGLLILRPGDVATWGGCFDGTLNPSYFSPAYYRVFAEFVPAQADHWHQLATDTYTLYAEYQASQDGLICGWANIDSGCTSGFDWDGVRAPWRVATDYAWFGDADARQTLLAMSEYVDAQGGIANVPFEPNSAFRGSLALSGIVTTQEKFDTYVSEWLANTENDNVYFQATLRVLFLMLAAGDFSRAPSPS